MPVADDGYLTNENRRALADSMIHVGNKYLDWTCVEATKEYRVFERRDEVRFRMVGKRRIEVSVPPIRSPVHGVDFNGMVFESPEDLYPTPFMDVLEKLIPYQLSRTELLHGRDEP